MASEGLRAESDHLALVFEILCSLRLVIQNPKMSRVPALKRPSHLVRSRIYHSPPKLTPTHADRSSVSAKFVVHDSLNKRIRLGVKSVCVHHYSEIEPNKKL